MVCKHCVALLQIEDLKTQLESCHQQLHDSNQHKQGLEFQLRTALEREQDIRTGYISPVSHRSFRASVRSCITCSALMGNLVVDSMSLFSVQQNSLLHLVTFFACCIYCKKSIQPTDIEATMRLQICALAWVCCMKKNIDILSLHWLPLLNPLPLCCRSVLFVNSCWPLL